MGRLGDFDIWVYDCEVFAHDWLFVFGHAETGRHESFWNDSEGLLSFMEEHPESLFAGFNSSRYDQYILKAIVAGCSPEEVKEVNDWIVGTDNLPWEHPLLKGARYRFNDVDLMKDTQMGTSLKSIEAHTGMSVEESSVAFDTDRPLSDAERADVEEYCRHDVDATERLLFLRAGYLETKLSLGERAGLEPARALAMTNAKLTAAVLGAERVERDDEREYEYPPNLRRERIPDEVFAFFDRVRDPSVPDDELWSSKLELEVGGCPVTLGFGGIHGAIPRYRGESNADVEIVNADVASYYPSLMIVNGYTSRNMPSPDTYKRIYEERLAAKRAGDKPTANALKLVLNTTYGATLNSYNDLYDPLMARSVCISGQLYLLELACTLAAEGMRIVQLNTDGVMVEVAGRVNEFDDACRAWQERTGFALEFDRVRTIAQKDVNNYALRLVDGTEKVKGGYLVRGIAPAGAFSVNNNATIVADAVRARLLDGTPVEETIRGCADPAAFQLVAKASHKYSEVYLTSRDASGEEIGRETVQKCNRVFAGLDRSLGRLYKVKAADGSVAKVESLPDHCLVSNGETGPDISLIDIDWYIALAEKRARDFEGGDMTAETKPAARAAKKTAAAKKPSGIHAKLAMARRMFLDAQVRKSGMNMHLEFEYFTLDDIVPAETRIFEEVGLLEQFAYLPEERRFVERRSEDGTVETETVETAPMAVAALIDVDDPSQRLEFRLPWVELPAIESRDGKKVGNPVQDMGRVQTYLRRYLKMQVLDIAEPDELDASLGEKEPARPVAKKAAKRPATDSERAKTAETVAAPEGKATKLQVTQLKKQIKKMKDDYGGVHPEVGAYIAALGAETSNLADITKARCEQAIRDLGEMKEGYDREERR